MGANGSSKHEWEMRWLFAMGVAAIFFLSLPAVFAGGLLPQLVSLFSNGGSQPGLSAGTPQSVADAMAMSVAIAERNFAWATYVLTAVGILFTVTILMVAFRGEIRFAKLLENWEKLKADIIEQQEELAEVYDNVEEETKRQIGAVCVPMADFMTTNTINEFLFGDEGDLSLTQRDVLASRVYQGVGLLVEYGESFEIKQDAVRRLSRVTLPTTIGFLDQVERDVLRFEPGPERQKLLDVILSTRVVVKEAVENTNNDPNTGPVARKGRRKTQRRL